MGTSVSVVSYYIVHSISRLTCQWRMAQSFLLTTLFFCFLSQGSSLSIFIPRPTAPPIYPWSLFIPTFPTSTKLPNTIPTDPKWKKVFSHDTSGGLFTNSDWKSKNTSNSSALLYSILDTMEDYRLSDGTFHLKLCYPLLKDGSSGCNEWTQTSNPVIESNIAGYKPIKIDFPLEFKGLGVNIPEYQENALIDNKPYHSWWFYPIGAKSYWRGPNTIPGPYLNDFTQNIPVTKVVLSVVKPDPKWKKIFSHDTSGGLFTDSDWNSKNAGNPSALLYSILDTMEDYRLSDGTFHLRLCYPLLKDGSSGCNEWTQTSNPVIQSNITGYKPININFPLDFKGLGVNIPKYQGDAMIDYKPDHPWWFYPVGANNYWGGPNTIPGPYLNDWAQNSPVTKVVLSVVQPGSSNLATTDIPNTCYDTGCKSHLGDEAECVYVLQGNWSLINNEYKINTDYVPNLCRG